MIMEEKINEAAKVDPIIVAQLLRGERPVDMPYEEFKVKRKMIQSFIKRKNRGYLFHKSKQITDLGEKGGKIVQGITYKKEK